MISQLAALKLAVKALTERRRKLYAAGEEAYKKGIDFDFATKGHKHYVEHSEAIRQLEDLQEILTDSGYQIEPEETQRKLL